MIPKIIHYCWLSNDPIPEDLSRYMKTWKQKLPDYEFMLWDFNRFDKNNSQWVKEAFEHKKYAFAADYIRLYALYHYGGIYLDMDVEVLKTFTPFLSLRTMIGFENGKCSKCRRSLFLQPLYRSRRKVIRQQQLGSVRRNNARRTFRIGFGRSWSLFLLPD